MERAGDGACTQIVPKDSVLKRAEVHQTGASKG